MTGTELLQFTLKESGDQVTRVFADFPDDAWDHKCAASTFTPFGMVEHLYECLVAVEKSLAGESHSWGTVTMAEDNGPARLAAFQSKRDEIVAAIIADASDSAQQTGIHYVGMHEPYHVGQMVMIRLDIDPEWNSYSIYSSE